jgi:carbon starvation protein
MNVLLILVISLFAFWLGYRYYARRVDKAFEVDGTHVMPSVELEDDVDYVPTRKFVLFGHHFASIAGGGPIIGPTVALIFGWMPVWLWIVLGTVFVGVVHDFSALLASVREKGRSMAEVAERCFGRAGFLSFVGFTIVMLLMVTSVFLNLTTTALSSKYPSSFFGEVSGYVSTVQVNGVEHAVIGGIASTSVIFITLCAPLLGWLLYRRNLNAYAAGALAIGICAVSVWVGLTWPLQISPFHWMIILSIYTVFAAGVPVWLVLQPRDFTNSFMLYGGVIAILAATVVLGGQGMTVKAPAFNLREAIPMMGYVWPLLFITVACGACSGFHALVAGGTSSKQLAQERPDAKVVAAGGMILEGIFAVGVILAVGSTLSFDEFRQIVFPSDPSVKANPILAFALSIGGMFDQAFGIPKVIGTVFGILMVEGFVVTTLDTAVRLNRYLFEELWRLLFPKPPRFLTSYVFNSLLCVVLMFLLAYFNAFKQLWTLFGSANQLLAALTLLTVSAWLLRKGKRSLFILVPGLFMLVTTLASLVLILVTDYLPKGNVMLAIGDVLLLALALQVVYLMWRHRRQAA